MSNFTEGAIAEAPLKAPAPGPAPGASVEASATASDYIAPSPEVGGVPAGKFQTSVSISWLGIAGILAAFLVLTTVAIACFWYKRNRYKKALQEQRNFYIQNAANQPREDWSDDEEQSRSSRKCKRAFHGSGERVVEQDMPVGSTGDPKPLCPGDKITSGSFRDKHMTGCFDSHQGEVFYTGEEGSQMGVRYSREELGNIEILTRISTPKNSASMLKRKAESESASLLGTLNRSHTIAASPTKEMDERNRLGRWTLRTFSLPAYHRKSSQEIVVTSWGLKGETKVEASKVISPLTPLPSSLPASPLELNLTAAPSSPKRSRLSSAAIHNPTFIVPPSTPPPPLPLPVTLDEGPEKTLQELRRAMKQAESKWTIANYCPAPPPPPLPVPYQAPTSPPPPPPPPRRSALGLSSLSDVNNNPPSFRDLVQPAPAPPPPPPPPPRRSITLPAKLLLANATGIEGRRDPPPPPPPPPLSSPSRKVTTPPSPPVSPPSLRQKFHTPPASPPPSLLPGGASGNGLFRPNLTPLTLPGRPDLVENLDFQDEQRLSKRFQKMRPLHWDKLKPDAPTVWDNIRNSME